MTDTEKKIHAIICDNAREHDPIQGYSHKYCLEETSAIFALLQQNNREYADTLIGEDDPITLPEKPNMDANPPQWEQLDKWILDMNTRRNELRAELKKKNENT